MTQSIFDGMTARDVKRIKSAGTEVKVPQGWSPISERTPADKAYIICAGEVSVRKGGEEIARLGEGQVIGEAAIVNHSLRNASVVALTPLELIHFTSEQLEALIEGLPAFADALNASAAARLGQE